MRRSLVHCALALLVWGCGDDEPGLPGGVFPPPFPDGPIGDGGDGDGGVGGSGGGGLPSGDAGSTAIAVVILDLADGSIVADEQVIRVQILSGERAPSVQTVKVNVTGSAESLLMKADSATPDIWSGPIDLIGVSSGPSELTATATPAGANPRDVTTKIDVQINNGPIVEIVNPVSGQAVGTIMDIVAEVKPPFEGELVDPASVVARVGDQQDLPMSPVSGTDTFEIRGVDLSQGYAPPLRGDTSLTVTANTQGVMSEARPGEASLVFNVDRLGPTLTSPTPAPGELVGGIIEISIVVNDPSGVEAGQVTVTLPGVPGAQQEFPMEPRGNGRYGLQFDTRRYGAPGPDDVIYPIYPSVLFKARDLAGNPSSFGLEFALDNRPPIIDLDPPLFREARKKDDAFQCSHAFDPLGADSANDLWTKPQNFDVRVMAFDAGNAPAGRDIEPLAGVDVGTVTLMVAAPAPGGEGLVEDSDGDGVCDRIAPQFDPAFVDVAPFTGATKAVSYHMIELEGGGVSNFTPEIGASCTVLGEPCAERGTTCQQFEETITDANGDETTIETLRCQPTCPTGDDESYDPDSSCSAIPLSNSVTNHILPWVAGISTPGTSKVFGIPPNFACGSRQVDTLAAGLSNGWLCIAVTATDNVGNVGVSAPLRICLDQAGGEGSSGYGSEGTPTCSSPPPSCRSACRARQVSDADYIWAQPNRLRGLGRCIDGGSNGPC